MRLGAWLVAGTMTLSAPSLAQVADSGSSVSDARVPEVAAPPDGGATADALPPDAGPVISEDGGEPDAGRWPSVSTAKLVPTPADVRPSNRGEAVALGSISSVLALTSLFIDVFPSPPIDGIVGYYHLGTELAANVPLIPVNPLDSAQVGGLQLAFAGGEVGLAAVARKHSQWDGAFGALSDLSLHQGIYAAYATYRDVREVGQSPAWTDGWQPWSGLDLLAAPMDVSNYLHPVVAVTLGVELYGAAGLVALNQYFDHPVLHAGTSLRDFGLGVLISWDAGITEEALFRGFEYEELKLWLGVWPARLIDMTLFTLAHVPGEIGEQVGTEGILIGLGTRALGALLFEYAYDQGGLPESVAFHAVYDTIIFTAGVLMGQSPIANDLGSFSAAPGKGAEVIIPVWGGTF